MSNTGTEIAKPLRFMNPGSLDENRGPYPTIAAANLAIPNTEKNGRNLREGKFVEIGVTPNFLTHWWNGGYADGNLVEYFGELLNKTSKRVLPEGRIIEDIDRPDLVGIYDTIEIDEMNNIISVISKNIITDNTFDRPDLESAIIDEEGYLIQLSEIIVPEIERDYTKRFWNPPLQIGSGFDFDKIPSGDDSMLVDYGKLIASWDAIMERNPTNPEIEPYITKQEIGRTGARNLPIYSYRFNPGDAKQKVLVIGGTHANEKMYIKVWNLFFNTLASQWQNDPVLEWLRWNIDITVLPCRCPDTLTFPARIRGSRTVPETPPIPISWAKSGTEVTVTFNVSDFPANDFLKGESYFSSVAPVYLQNKMCVGIMTSSDRIALPLNAYRLKRVISGNSIVIDSPDSSGGLSGTGTLQVWTDPNRNVYAKGLLTWENFTSTMDQPQPDDLNIVYSQLDNKGTQPFALKEERVFKDLLDNGGYDFVIDGHSPSGDHYFRYDPRVAMPEIDQVIANIKKFSGNYVMSSFSQLVPDAIDHPYPSCYHATQNRKNLYTVEWGSGMFTATDKNVTDAMRWMVVVLTELLRIKH